MYFVAGYELGYCHLTIFCGIVGTLEGIEHVTHTILNQLNRLNHGIQVDESKLPVKTVNNKLRYNTQFTI